MAQGRTILESDAIAASAATPETPLDTGFGAEYRELARQRRFVREGEDVDWREQAAPPRRSRAAAPAPKPAPAPAAPPARSAPSAAAIQSPAVARSAAPLPNAPTLRRASVDPRISDDQRATLRELARMSDRLVDAREQLVAANARAEHLSADLDAARAELRAGEQRVIASRVLVQDAQRQTHAIAERCAWLESRCETLQEALELAVNASWTTRWKWRREQRARSRAAATR